MAGFEDFTLAELSAISFFKSYEEKRNSLITRIVDAFRNKELEQYNFKKYESYDESPKIGDWRGVIFHNADGDSPTDVGEMATSWFFIGLFTNADDEIYPKSINSAIPDVFCGVIKWFKRSREMKAVLEELQGSQMLTDIKPDFEMTLRRGDDEYSNYIAIGRKETLLNFIQKKNHEHEILDFLKRGYDRLIERKEVLNKLLSNIS